MGANEKREAALHPVSDELEQLRRLHEVATERTVQLAAVIEGLRGLADAIEQDSHCSHLARDIRGWTDDADTDAVLRERDAAAVMAFATHYLRVDDYRKAEKYAAEIREGTDRG
jgi:hypothetical protein